MRWLVSDCLVLARRNLAHIRQIPEKLLDVTLQPMMFVLLFAFVFGGVIDVPGGNYREYLIGGILVQTLAFGMMGPGMSIATDLSEGIIDRFRSLPMSRSAYLIGHLIAEFAARCSRSRCSWSPASSSAGASHPTCSTRSPASALLLLFAIAMIWLGTLIGVIVRSPDAVQGIAFMVVFPLTFVATRSCRSAGCPTGCSSSPNGTRSARSSPRSRTLFGNPTATPADAAWPLQHPVIAASPGRGDPRDRRAVAFARFRKRTTE